MKSIFQDETRRELRERLAPMLDVRRAANRTAAAKLQ